MNNNIIAVRKVLIYSVVFLLLGQLNIHGQILSEIHPSIGGSCLIEKAKVDSVRAYYEKTFPEGDIEAILEEEVFFTLIGDSWYNCAYPKKILCSSHLEPVGELEYSCEQAHDFDLRTAWVEGKTGYGIGEYIEYEFSYAGYDTPITDVIIINGYVKSAAAWENNSRVKSIKLFIDDSPYAILHLQDIPNYQRFEIGEFSPKPNKPIKLRFEIIDVYKGLKWDDTALTELEFDGLGCLCVSEKSTVVTKDLGNIKIENVSVNDTIMAFDGEKVVPSRVVQVHKVVHHSLIQLSFGDRSLLVTQDHPIYVQGKGWCSYKPSITNSYSNHSEVEKYEIGDLCFLLENGEIIQSQISDLQIMQGSYNTYSIDLENPEYSFFANGILVGVEAL